MSLMETLVAMAVILILISVLIGTGSYMKTRASIDLTRGMLETLSTALEKYYDDTGDFPFDTDTDVPEDGILNNYLIADLANDLAGTVTSGILPDHQAVNPTPPPDTILISSASSAALFYFLDKHPDSRAIVEAVSNTLITNKDAAETNIMITIGTNPAIDLLRYIDTWGTSIRYEYLTGTAFPVLTSAGPDKIFDTPDDITSQ